jgi:Protein of unknown function, DUF481
MYINTYWARARRGLTAFSLSWLVCGSPATSVLGAQEPGWSGNAQGSANALFGAAHTRLVAGTLEAGRADSTLQIRSQFLLSYGDDRTDAGDRQVTARATKMSLGLDLVPFNRYSPFWFGSVESRLQQRIARRYDSGLGGKVTFVHTEPTKLDFSLALLLERTTPLVIDGPPTPILTRARWSARFRVGHQLTPSLRVNHVTFYQPTVDRLGAYTIDTLTQLEDRLWTALSFTASLHDVVDSEARLRGAASNHDGQLLFGLRTSF